MRHTQTQAQQVTTLSTLRLRSQANQFLTQALVLRQNQRELRAEHALRDVQVLSSLLQCTSGKTQAERRLNQQERRGHIVQESLNIVAQNVLARNENVLKLQGAGLGAVQRQQVAVVVNTQALDVLANGHDVAVRVALRCVLHSHGKNNHAARVQVRCPRHGTVELQTALNEGALHLDRCQTRSLLVCRRHGGGAADGRIRQTGGQVATHSVKERNGRAVSPQGERRGGVLGGKVESHRNLGYQGTAVAAQGNQAVLSDFTQVFEGGTLAAVNSICVGSGECEHLLALGVIVEGFESELGHGVSPKRGASRLCVQLEQSVNGGADGLTGANNSFFVGCVVEAEALCGVFANVGAQEGNLGYFSVLGGVRLLAGQVLFHSNLCGDVPLNQVVCVLLELLDVFELCADQADCVGACDGCALTDCCGEVGAECGVLGFDDDEDDLVVCRDLGFDELGAVGQGRVDGLDECGCFVLGRLCGGQFYQVKCHDFLLG